VLIGYSGVRCFVCCAASSRTVPRACFPSTGQTQQPSAPAEVRTLALSIVRERYADFGPTMAAEKLAEHHGCSVSRETLRGWMIADGLWQDRRHRLPAPHQPRRRRDCLGELVQIDGSEHAWLRIAARRARCWLRG
jgi:hypothetical protein